VLRPRPHRFAVGKPVARLQRGRHFQRVAHRQQRLHVIARPPQRGPPQIVQQAQARIFQDQRTAGGDTAHDNDREIQIAFLNKVANQLGALGDALAAQKQQARPAPVRADLLHDPLVQRRDGRTLLDMRKLLMLRRGCRCAAQKRDVAREQRRS